MPAPDNNNLIPISSEWKGHSTLGSDKTGKEGIKDTFPEDKGIPPIVQKQIDAVPDPKAPKA